jgi:hypothetical protein
MAITGSMIVGWLNSSTQYFVDATNGFDSNDGHSPQKPWKTIAKVNGFSFSSVSLVLFKRGETWAEVLNTPITNATISAYGTGASPVYDYNIFLLETSDLFLLETGDYLSMEA